MSPLTQRRWIHDWQLRWATLESTSPPAAASTGWRPVEAAAGGSLGPLSCGCLTDFGQDIGPLGNRGDLRPGPVPYESAVDGRLDTRRRIDKQPPQNLGRKTIADRANPGMPIHSNKLLQLPLVGPEVLAA